ncbi:MAG: tRNA pseudouridine(55) synthase TruB [Oscillospiraceae bacterium]|nr:tRNA pseudouridine(55) synthase TruB [Oscillospiraceae bacterium]
MNGILLIDKPAGWTSFDVIGKLRGILKTRRLGHAGTLDPMATGVLPVFVGYATKACGILPTEDKAYQADFQLGTETDTQDSTGTVLRQSAFPVLTQAQLLAAIPQGDILQLPPMYSAVKVGGKKLYELAREGKTAERTPRPAQVYSVRILRYDPQTGAGSAEIFCGKGTYVRTLLHDMGQTLGCGAMMTGLRRTQACGFPVTQCHSIEEVQQAADLGRAEELLIPIEQAFSGLAQIHLNREQTRLYRNGVKLTLDQIGQGHSGGEPQRYAVYGDPEGFLGTAYPDREAGVLRVERNLREPDQTN